MSKMIGMNPEEVRAKAGLLRSQLSILEAAAHTVENAANSSLNPLSYGIQPGGLVIAPFSIAGTQSAASRIRAARSSAIELTAKLVLEAEQQEGISSATDDSYILFNVGNVPETRRPRTAIDVFRLIKGALGAYSNIKAIVKVAQYGAGAVWVAKNVREASSVKALADAMHFSPAFKGIGKAGEVLKGGAKAAKVFGWVGVGLGAIDTVQAAREGRTVDAIWSGAKTGLAVAALLTPPPVSIVLGVTSAAIAVGELIYANREAIGNTIGDASRTVNDVASNLGRGAANVASSVVGGIADAGRKLWPFGH